MSSKFITIIAGVGPGTGAGVARKFAKAYPTVLLARKPESYNDLVKQIEQEGGTALGISTDISDEASVKNAFNQIEEKFGKDVKAAAAVFNASGPFTRKPFLEQSVEDFTKSWDVLLKGAVIFSQAALPLLLRSQEGEHPPSLIFTGATASVKANAHVATFNTGKYGLRALSSSLAKEFGPKGVHVGHAIIDGIIDTPKAKEYFKDAGPDRKISPDAIAEAYWNLHTQPRSTWTWEIDIRSWQEPW